jgi:hypothetical protein
MLDGAAKASSSSSSCAALTDSSRSWSAAILVGSASLISWGMVVSLVNLDGFLSDQRDEPIQLTGKTGQAARDVFQDAETIRGNIGTARHRFILAGECLALQCGQHPSDFLFDRAPDKNRRAAARRFRARRSQCLGAG